MLKLARQTGEFGDPHIFTLPHPDTFQFGLIWTSTTLSEDHDLLAIVIAPQALPWMGEPSAVFDDEGGAEDGQAS